MTLKSVEETRVEWFGKINVYSKMAFLVSFFAGMLTHGFMLLNKIPFYDDIALLFHTGGTYKNGRWFLGVIGAIEYRMFGDNFSTPMCKGLIAIVLVSLAAALVVSLFDIRNKSYIFFISCIMVVYPAVTVIMGYMFMAQCFTIALFLGVIGAWATVKKKYGFLVGIVCICLSLGLYQAYLAVPAVLFLMALICDLFAEKEFPQIFKTAVRYLLTLVLGLVVYFIINKVFLALKGAQLTQYQGISDMGQTTIGDLIARVGTAYRHFVQLPFADWQGLNTSALMKVLFGLCILLTIGIITFNIIKIKNIWNKILLAVITVLLPLAVNLIYVMCDEEKVYVHGLMVYASVFVLLLPLILLYVHSQNQKKDSKKNVVVVTEWTAFAVAALTILYYVGYNNIAYTQSAMIQSQVDAYSTNFVAAIKNADGYADEYPIILVQDPDREEPYDFMDKSMYIFTEFEQIQITAYNTDMLCWMSNYSLPDYLKYRTGFNTENMKDYGELLENGEVEKLDFVDEMPCYPDDGSIRVEDERIIVKLSDY